VLTELYDYFGHQRFASLLGRTLVEIRGAFEGSEEVVLMTADKKAYRLHGDSGYVLDTRLEDIAGNVADLVGTPLLMAQVVSSQAAPSDLKSYGEWESSTWTYYKLATVKGYVTLRWWANSDGNYCEEVFCSEITTPFF